MIRIFAGAMVVALLAALCIFPQADVEGCAAVRRENGPSISIAEESAIIVWDPAKKVQHFIRRAAFDTKSPDFGFLVPTPTVPKLPLVEVEDGIFRAMDSWLVPKTVEKTRTSFAPLLCMFGCMTATKSDMRTGKADKDSVRVLHEQKVGGFETAVLEADNTEDLGNWLKKNGYSSDPELQSWLVPYIGAKWKITAFKISKDPNTGGLATTKAVRMSFATERPFFPYREPEGKPTKEEEKKGGHESRRLRVLFVSDKRMEGKLGDQSWHAAVKWSDQLNEIQRRQIATDSGVPEAEIPAAAWLTSFDDSASPRPGKEEVYFDPAKDQTPIRPQIIHYNDVWVPIDCAVFGLLAVIGVVTVAAKLLRAKAG